MYQVLLRGPTKVEYLFLKHSQDARPPLNPSKETLVAINTHFWDWIWWVATKATVGRHDLVAGHLTQLYGHLLRPMGVETVPDTIDAAIHAFLARRDELEAVRPLGAQGAGGRGTPRHSSHRRHHLA